MADTVLEAGEHIPLNRGSSNNHTTGSGCDEKDIENYLSSYDIHIIKEQQDCDEIFEYPSNRELDTGRYNGYCALGMRPSLDDSWENATDSDANDVSTNSYEDDDENCSGEFVSFWRHDLLNGDGSSASQDDKDPFQFLSNIWRYPLPQYSCIVNNGDNRAAMVRDLFHHKQKGELDRRRASSSNSQMTRIFGSRQSCCVKEMAPSSNDSWLRKQQKAHQVETNLTHNKIPSLPIIRPLLRGSGYNDRWNEKQTATDDEVECNGNENDANDQSIRRDHADVIQSLSRGIVGRTDDTLLSITNSEHITPMRTEKIVSRITSSFKRISSQSHITQLHSLVQKEDWSLATILLQSNPELAKTWYHVERLYDGKYGVAVLPIHAACAMRPPPSFVDFIAELYPEGLLEKDKAFHRVPLHVACREVAESGVIRVLCEMEPKCVDEKDMYKRVPLHYLIKNYFSFGDDDGDVMLDKLDTDDGMNAMKILINTSPNCVRAADHRGWLPIHVACSSSSRKGMIRVIKLLLEIWPESIHVKTGMGSDALACVNVAGVHHPTKDRVIALLQEAKSR